MNKYSSTVKPEYTEETMGKSTFYYCGDPGCWIGGI